MLLTAEGIGLLALAVALAGPVPAALARAAWPARSPRAALVLWQAVGLGGGLAILGAGLTLAVSGLHRSWLGGIAALPGAVAGGLPAGRAASPGLGALGWTGVALTAVAGGWLAVVAVTSTARLTLARREHRRRLDLLADELALADLLAGTGGGPVPASATQPGATQPAASHDDASQADPSQRDPSQRDPSQRDPSQRDPSQRDASQRDPSHDDASQPGLRVRLLDHPAAAAYCLPGVRPRIVLSRGVLDALSRAELSAVVAHEKAHARGRHDLVIQPFRAWVATFPFLPSGRGALAAVELLVELTADNAVSRGGQRAELETALRRLAVPGPAVRGPAAPAQAGGHRQAADRARRLAGPPRPLSRLAAGAVCAAAVALVLVPPAILIVS